MKIGITTDFHMNPGDIFRPNGLSKYDQWIDLGDTLNIIPAGMGKWRTPDGRKTVESVAKSHDNIILIWKNHGGRGEWVSELFEDYPHVKVVDDYELFVGDRDYLFRHGSEYTDWRLWSVGADDVTAFMTRFPLIRSLWFRFCISRGWLPGSMKSRMVGISKDGIKKKYQKIVGGMWALALADISTRDHPTTLFMGHSHQEGFVASGDYEVVSLENCQLMELEV